jgi:hypothetical protein
MVLQRQGPGIKTLWGKRLTPVLLKQGLVLFPPSLNQLGKTASLKNKSKGESVVKTRLSNPRR